MYFTVFPSWIHEFSKFLRFWGEARDFSHDRASMEAARTFRQVVHLKNRGNLINILKYWKIQNKIKKMKTLYNIMILYHEHSSNVIIVNVIVEKKYCRLSWGISRMLFLSRTHLFLTSRELRRPTGYQKSCRRGIQRRSELSLPIAVPWYELIRIETTSKSNRRFNNFSKIYWF